MPRKKAPEIVCYKCKQKFLGLDSFRGEYRIPHGGVKNIQLCNKCLHETNALWWGETKTIERHIQEKIEYYTRQHGIDRYADAKRTACEEISEYLTDHCNIFNGHNNKAPNEKDLSQLELTARNIIHDDFKINCAEQITLLKGDVYRYKVDGLILTGRREVVLEFDSSYYHSTDEQKERDSHKDFMLTEYGDYVVVRISEDIIKNDKPGFKSLVLNAIFGTKQSNPRLSLSTKIPTSPSSSV